MNRNLFKAALPHIIAVGIFLIVAVVYCKPALDGKVVFQHDMLGYKGMVQQSLEYKDKYGHFPLWTESMFSGMPAYNIAMEAKYKLSIGYLSYVLTWGLPKPISFFFLACVCFYILTQVLRISPWIGILSAMAYAWSTYDPIIVVVGHETKMLAIAYAPGVIAGLLVIFRGRYLLGAALLTSFFSFQVGTQHLQVVYYTLISAGLLTLFFLVNSWQQGQLKNGLIGVGIAIICGGIGFATLAVANLPVQELAKETMRGGRTELTGASNTNKYISNNGLSKDYAFGWSYGIGETLTLIAPEAFGGGSSGKEITGNSKFVDKMTEVGVPEDNALQMANGYAYWGAQPFTNGPVYLGAVCCFLFFLGLVFVKGWQKWWLVSVAVVGILLAWGKNFSALNYFLFDHLPFYNKFRAPAMALVLPQFAFPLLGALGLNQLLTGGESKEAVWKKFRKVVFITAGVLVVLIGFYFMADYKGVNDTGLRDNYSNALLQQLARGQQPTPEMQQQARDFGNAIIKGLQSDRQSIFGGDLLRTFLLIAAAVVLVGLYLKDKFRQGILLGALILLSSYDLLSVGRRYLNEESFAEPADFEASLAPTAADMKIKSDPDKNFRVFDQSAGDPFQDSRASYHHNSVGGYSPAKLGLYQDLIEHQLTKGNMMVFNMLNTRYFIQRNPSTGQSDAMLNANAFGPCWLVKNIHYVKDGNEEMKALDSLNTRDTAIVQEKYRALVKGEPVPDSSASIKLIENLNDKITYKVSARTNQFAVFSEVYYDKGWNVFLDGNKADYCKVDYILRGMSVPAGEHTIEFRFEPRSYELGDIIGFSASILAYLIVIIAIVAEWRKRQTAK
ncbi:MAG: YfhO family protein [Puia sp.]|nr:YfhO family protein [Puia sp.]